MRVPAELRVRFGYGGVRVALRPAPERLPGLRVALLAGAGNVDMEEPTVRGIVDSENGGVLEPDVSFALPLVDRLGVHASASWRFAFEFETLVGVDSGELAGPTLGVGLTFGPF